MPTITCPRCDGLGTICNRCGRPRTRRKPGDFGRVCCPRAQIVRCSTHVQTVHRCDVCDGLMLNRGTSLEFNVEPMSRVIACSSCLKEWRDRKAVAFDEWLQKTRPDYAHAVHARVGEMISQIARYIRTLSHDGSRADLLAAGLDRERVAAGIERGEHLLYPVAGRLVSQVEPAQPVDRPRSITTGPTITLHFDEARRLEPGEHWRDDDPH